MGFANKCSGQDLYLENGGIFINRLGRDHELIYLHKIFPRPNFSTSKKLKMRGLDIYGDYYKFISDCNGVVLFERSVHLFGYNVEIARSLDPERQSAVSVEGEVAEFLAAYPHLTPDWFPVGGVSAQSKSYWICLDDNGRSAIFGANCKRYFDTFYDCVKFIVELFYLYSGCTAPSDSVLIEIEEILDGVSN